MLRTEADLVRSLSGTFTLGELHQLVEGAGIAGRDGGYERVQDGKHRWKRRVRSSLQTLKAQGRAERIGEGTWVINGTTDVPHRALLVLLGAPSELELVLGPATDVLRSADGPISLVLADSPWGLKRQGDGGRIEHAYTRNSELVVPGYVDVPEDEYQEFTYRWVEAARDALKPGGYLAAITGPSKAARIQVAAEDLGMSFVNQVVAGRPFPMYVTRRFAHAHYVVTVMTNGPADSRTRYFEAPDDLPKARTGNDYPMDFWTDVPKYERTGLLRYDNALPPLLVSRLVRAFTEGGWTDLVADPFLGSGTTAAVCLREQRRFIGGDVNPQALRFTMGRILNEELPQFALA